MILSLQFSYRKIVISLPAFSKVGMISIICQEVPKTESICLPSTCFKCPILVRPLFCATLNDYIPNFLCDDLHQIKIGTIQVIIVYRKNDLILIMTPEKQDKTLELSKQWSPDSTLARNEVIMKTVNISSKSVKYDKICSNY